MGPPGSACLAARCFILLLSTLLKSTQTAIILKENINSTTGLPNQPTISMMNLALNKTTYQSSFYSDTHSNGSGAHAVDGVLDPSFYGGHPMFHVNDPAGGPNWIIVDLLEMYNIIYVTIYNRLDCCSSRESNIIIGLLSVYTVGQQVVRGSYPLCGTYPGSASGVSILDITCEDNSLIARYVVVQQPSNGSGYLAFAEIQVYGTSADSSARGCPSTYGINQPTIRDPKRPSVNFAYYKPTYQSSNYNEIPATSDGCAYHAVDGILDPSFFGGHPMFSTNDLAGGPNWMVVDLRAKYKISLVVVYNRLDCCGDRENNLTIGLLSNFTPEQQIIRGSYPLCGTYPGSASGVQILEIKCDPNASAAQYVIAQQPASGKGYLQFAEIEVYGIPALENKQCPSGWDVYPAGDRCYKLITEMKDWYEHLQTCYAFHPWSHLVMVSNASDANHTNNYLNTKKAILSEKCVNKNPSFLKIWTAGQRQNPKNATSPWGWRPFVYRFLPFSTYNKYSNWMEGEPNNAYGQEACVHLKFGSNNDYQWNDVACSNAEASLEHRQAFFDNANVAMCALCEINFS